MEYSFIAFILRDSQYSPEDFGNLMGVSGMTLRRWLKKSPQEKIPPFYLPAIREACIQLIRMGKISADAPFIRNFLSAAEKNQIELVINHLGLTQEFSLQNATEEKILSGLSQIGSQSNKRVDVEENKKKIFSFQLQGREWVNRIIQLWEIIQSKSNLTKGKMVAYGALFYLLTPLDFVPDYFPLFGLLDDFAILGLATSYYAKQDTTPL